MSTYEIAAGLEAFVTRATARRAGAGARSSPPHSISHPPFCARRGPRWLTAALLLLAGVAARAEVRGVSATGFTVTVQRTVTAAPGRVYEAIGRVERWWSSGHTWSGSSANLTLSMQAGGCFCERWPGGSVEHGRVIFAQPGRLLRLQAPLGPLQSLPVNAVLGFELAAAGEGTALRVTFTVAGGGADLATLAGPVEAVITEQVDGLVRFVQATPR